MSEKDWIQHPRKPQDFPGVPFVIDDRERSELERPAAEKSHAVIYDKATDSDPLPKRLKRRGIDLICPHKSSRVKPLTQDGRKMRRYKRRWKMKRSIAWVANFRRLVVRYEHKVNIYHAFFQVARLLITLRQFATSDARNKFRRLYPQIRLS